MISQNTTLTFLIDHFKLLVELHGENAIEAAQNVFGPRIQQQENNIIVKDTIPYSKLFEEKVLEKVKLFYKDKYKVSKQTFVKDGKKFIPDIVVVDYAVFDVKSGAISTEELEKLIEYGKLAKVEVTGLILSNMKTISPTHRKFCIDHRIHVLFDETLEKGLVGIPEIGTLIQEYPKNHVSRVSIEGLDQKYLDLFFESAKNIPSNITGEVCLKLWPLRKEIITFYRKCRISDNSKTKCMEMIKTEFKILNAPPTIKRFIDLVFQSMITFYQQ